MRVSSLCGPVALFSLAVSGCAQRTYEIDFAQAHDFHWNGKLSITETERMYLGPLLTLNNDWAVSHIGLGANGGPMASVDIREGQHPVARVGIDVPTETQILGTDAVWRGSTAVIITDPSALAEALSTVASQPSGRQSRITTLRTIREDKRPFVDHADELELVDWWAIALQAATDVTIEFRIPSEGLTIEMRGDPHKYGPATLEIRKGDGSVLKRFEEQQVEVMIAK